ncbi:response regulator [Natronorubrum texcoconense]|uniref:Response regulator receiver domain-containing protein n=1 Tax=Natronorubrum texcoconense TaxID=1095776 RepID=A0A1G8XY94_9EURY|nr:response regulator [Natronorubrum texcoconense]SDJ95518.1 Response regulator receiver domain-containing protein [Natronorubrum texcoconense]
MVEEPLHVLVVEDNRGDVRLIENGFEESSVERSLTVVNDGEAALDYLYRRNGYESEAKPDLVLLDLNVPKKTGRDVLEQIGGERDLRSIPLLVLSGSQAENHILETHELGADGYFVKPVDPHEFISLVGRVANSIATSGTLPPGEYSEIDRRT